MSRLLPFSDQYAIVSAAIITQQDNFFNTIYRIISAIMKKLDFSGPVVYEKTTCPDREPIREQVL